MLTATFQLVEKFATHLNANNVPLLTPQLPLFPHEYLSIQIAKINKNKPIIHIRQGDLFNRTNNVPLFDTRQSRIY